MLPAPVGYQAALRGPHRRVSYIDATDINGNVLARSIPIAAGRVTANLTNRVTRTASFSVPHEWIPQAADDPLSPYHSVARIRSGIALGDGTEITFPIFTGRVYDAAIDESGLAVFRADDLAADVVAARFEQPTPSRAGQFVTYLAEIQRLILDAVPQAQFYPDADNGLRIPTLVWDEDRGKALDDLAEAIGSRWYALGDGTFTVRPFSYDPAPAVQEFSEGPQGLMSRARVQFTRDGSANSVVVVSERLDGTDPVRVVRRDNIPGSPTMWGGPFGKVTQVIKLQSPATQTEATRLAETQLRAARALTEQWTSYVVPDQAIEPGDSVRLRYRGRMADQILDGVTYPLGATELMSLTSRSSIRLEGVS